MEFWKKKTLDEKIACLGSLPHLVYTHNPTMKKGKRHKFQWDLSRVVKLDDDCTYSFAGRERIDG